MYLTQIIQRFFKNMDVWFNPLMNVSLKNGGNGLLEMRYIPYPLKTNTFSFYVMLIDDERMELIGVFVPVHSRTNMCECPIQTQFVRRIENV